MSLGGNALSCRLAKFEKSLELYSILILPEEVRRAFRSNSIVSGCVTSQSAKALELHMNVIADNHCKAMICIDMKCT